MAQEPYVYQLPDEQLFTVEVDEIPYKDKIHDQDAYTTYLNLGVKAPIPENIAISAGNQIEQTWSFMQFKQKAATALSSGGINANKGYSERQYWSGIEPVEFTFEVTFNTYYSSKIDVIQPIQNLMALSVARESNLLTKGLSEMMFKVDEFWVSPPTVILRVGRFLLLDKLYIKSLNVTYSNKLDTEYLPMSATASITFLPRDPMGYNGWARSLNELLQQDI